MALLVAQAYASFAPALFFKIVAPRGRASSTLMSADVIPTLASLMGPEIFWGGEGPPYSRREDDVKGYDGGGDDVRGYDGGGDDGDRGGARARA